MNKYQVVMPNGDIAAVAADSMQNVEGDLKFFVAGTQVGEFRYWHAWNLITPADVPEIKTPPKADPVALRELVAGPPDDPITTFAQAMAAKIDPYSGRG